MREKAFQDYYPDDVSHCWGCGRLNADKLHIESRWDGDKTLCTFEPRSYHTAIPGCVYGGLIASLIDCHATGTAATAAYRVRGRPMDTEPPLRFVTASLHVDYHRPTPIGVPLEVRGRIEEVKEREVAVSATLSANGEDCASGRVVCVQMPDGMRRNKATPASAVSIHRPRAAQCGLTSAIRARSGRNPCAGGSLARIGAIPRRSGEL